MPRTILRVFLSVFAITVAGAIIQRWQAGHWWDIGYCLSLAIPLAIMPVAVYFMFVPRRIEWSASGFFIRTWACANTFPWEQLHAYGSGRGVFLLQFSEVRTFQIYSGAFDPAQWRAFQQFLTANYPGKHARSWFGTRAVGRRA